MDFADKSLFLEAMGDVTPLKNGENQQWLKSQKTPVRQPPDLTQIDNFLTTDFLEIVPLNTPLEFKREGVQQGVLNKLRLGKYPQQASLNLLRQPVEQCRQMLFNYIITARQEGFRNILIIHGKGREDKSHPNIVRSFLARWLVEFEDIQAFCCALPHHGGSGACYVALKKSPEAKQETWEQHAKRSR
ncbi:DNA endonuclease SmrA [Citrobacter sp. JGM124]|uniref:DNA endonuclease SmrA n=1 Tax=Citrobacter sp. JGM124 TaxID=2799789 RepID=UPI001BAD68E8|nr:DNA endonuclease SmrA [Citrobacter sp. JGM124]MBS0847442.1 DNA endonuclease SmrA [Citrobacter sp. JGM124]